MTALIEQIKSDVARLNETWLAGRFDELTGFFHPGVVLAPPGFGPRTVGRDALIASYVEFAAQALVIEFTTGEIQADHAGATIVTACPWKMTYEYRDATFTESGWDVLVFAEETGRWAVVWRTMVIDERAATSS
jgi:hypothetical protein